MDQDAVVTAFETGGFEAAFAKKSDLELADYVKGLNHLMIHLRWEKKDLAGIAQVADAVEAAVGNSDDEDVLGAWKAVCFNRAVFFWRGWGDQDVDVSVGDEELAGRYAQLNFDLAIQLGKTGVPLGRAEWLVGAFCWACGDSAGAAECFGRAAEFTATGDDPLEPMMCMAYRKAAKGENVEEILGELDAAENGEFYAGQVRSAMAVYGSG